MIAQVVARLADRFFERNVTWKPVVRTYDELYDQSLETLESLANAGDANACFVLGDIFDQGMKCERQDRRLALEWYHKAADLGQGDALNNLGSMYQHGDGGLNVDMDKSRDYYERAAAVGCGAALNNLAHFYSNGQGGLPKNEKKALGLFKKAVRRGYANAGVALGYRYREGKGCRKSFVRGLYWYRVAEKADDPSGCYNIACLYYFGRKLPQDYARAVALLKRGDAQQHAASRSLLALAFEHGSAVERDFERALELYEMAHGADGSDYQEEIDRVLGKMGEALSNESDPEDRIADLRKMVFNPQRRFRVRALLHELGRIESLLRETERLTPALEGQMKLTGAYAQWMVGDRACADWIDAALGIEKLNPFMMPFEEAALLHAKARLSISVSAWRSAISTLADAEAVSRAHPHDARIAHFVIASDMGYCLHEAGDYEEARSVNRALLAQLEKSPEKFDFLLARTLANLAQNEFFFERHQEVVSLYERRLALVEEMKDDEMIFSTLRDIAIASFKAGRTDEAEGFFKRRIDMADRMGHQRDILEARADLDEFLVRVRKSYTLQ